MEQEINAVIQQIFSKLMAIKTVSRVTMAVITLCWELKDLGSSCDVLCKWLNSPNIYGVATTEQNH